MGFIGDLERESDDDSPGVGAVEFADREQESEALAASLGFIEEVLRGGRDIDAFHHVLTFYGGSGTGKTSLSSRLQAWLQGDLVNDHWGPPPQIANVHCVRWDLNQSQGEIDVISMLMSLRAALPPIPGKWTFLDMALLSYFQAARPGENLVLRAGNTQHGETLQGAFEALAGDVGHLLDVTTGIASQSVKLLVELARRKYASYQLSRYPRLARLIDDCNAQEASASPSPELAARVLRVADRQISEIADPARRPLLVIFIDHFEKLQRDDRRNGEIAINHLVAALPQSLFVITGRHRLDWDDPARISLPYHGAKWWPQLVDTATDNPRQHRLGMLSPHDTELVLRRRGVRQGFALNDEALQRVVKRVGGWPVYISTICTLAAGLSGGTGATVAAEDLDRPLDDVVRRVLENLSEAQARAFHGACLLPYFDDALAAAAAGVAEGDVRSMRARAMIEPSDDPRWPYRVHDAIRGIIRQPGSSVAGGWSSRDWTTAADRAIAFVEQRFSTALEQGDEMAVVATAGLAIRIAAENGTWADWFLPPHHPQPGVSRPSAYSAAPFEALAPRAPTQAAHPETAALLRFFAARNNRDHEESVRMLTELAEGDTVVARQARLWTAYKERAAGRIEAAVAALQILVERYPNWSIPIGQIGNTLADGRRFVEALEYAEGITGWSQRYVRSNICLNLGLLLDERVIPWEERVASNARFRVELLSARRKWEARVGRVIEPVIRESLITAVNAGHPGAQRDCHYAAACLHLADEVLLAEDLRQLEVLDSRALRTSSHLPELLALRSMLTGSEADAQRAFALWQAAPVRNSAWIPVETYLMALGQPVTPDETQWPEPEQDVRDRWLQIGQGILERVRS